MITKAYCTYQTGNIDCDSYLEMDILRQEFPVVNNVKYRRPPRYNLERMNQPDVNAHTLGGAALMGEGEFDMTLLKDYG